ncbi:MAG: hypothetical protein JW816_00975 [Candidatus Buchananbacteria bacterium]|nr:hypothetical protein [Candidatus Buchananbacteria bacterium]
MKINYDNYHQALDYLNQIGNISSPNRLKKPNGRALFLKRFEYFLKLLGNPQNNFKYIHVGGTSGKGSVSTMVQSILTQAGFNAGLFTSPNVTAPIEKIKVKNQLISPDEFVAVLNSIKPAIDYAYQHSPYGRPSWFEIWAAMAFVYFRNKKCDYVVLEVGLGGRFDATNIIKKSEIAIINKVGLDHVDVLGNTISEIAKEKAGIIKPNSILFTPNTNSPAVLKVLKQTCQKVGAEFNLIKPPVKKYNLLMTGLHQQINAEIAANACRRLGVKESAINHGLAKTKMAGRFEIIQKNPLVILDGAHNESKMQSVVKNIENLTYSKNSGSTLSKVKKLTYRKLYLIIALTAERDGQKIFKEVGKLADHLFITRYQTSSRKCYSPLKLKKIIKTKAKKEIFLDPHQAMKKALKLATKKDLILVTGSFYLVGDIRELWRSEEQILKERKI